MSKFSERAAYTPSAKFPTIGTKISGTVLSVVNDAPIPIFEGGRMVGNRVGLDKKPMHQVDVTIETAEKKKLVFHTNGPLFDAIDAALDEAGLTDLISGYSISVEYTGDGESAAAGLNPPKEYAVEIAPAK